VTVQTVYAAFGSEAGIMKALLAEMEDDAQAPLGGSASPPHMSQPPGCGRSRAGRPASCRPAGDHDRGTSGRLPAITEPKAVCDRRRRDRASTALSHQWNPGAISAPTLDRRHATDRAWLLTGIELCLTATNGCGWSDTDYIN